MAIVSMKALLETGVHFGHRTRKWNPHMKNYIFTERNGIHIIDLQQTLESLEESYALIRDTVANGGEVLFVGTKRQAQETMQLEAERCGMPYVNMRWLGGTLTNWRTIRSRIDELKDLERRRDEGEFDLLTKKEALMLNRKIDKLQERLGGIREMNGLPEILYVVDVKGEETAVHEANLLEIPVVALVDTNCEPGNIDYVIPSNDDAIRAIKLLTSTVADAVLEGVAMRKDRQEEDVEGSAGAQMAPEFEEMADEELLGEATLAKLQTGEYGDEEEEQAEEEPEEGEAEDKGDDAEPVAEAAEEADEETEEAEEADDAEAESDEEESSDEADDDGDDDVDDDNDADEDGDDGEQEEVAEEDEKEE